MERIPQLLSDYFDGDLTAGEAEELAQHLRQDPRLLAEFVELYQLHRILETDLRPFAQAEFQAAVFAELRRDQEAFVGSVMRELEVGRRSDPAAPGLSRRSSPGLASWLARLRPSAWIPRWAAPALAAGAAVVLAGAAYLELKPEPVRAWVRELNGRATVERGRHTVPAANGLPLRPGDVLQTDTGATLVVQYLGERTRLELKPESSLRVASPRRGKRLELIAGRVDAVVDPQPKDRPMILVARDSEARVLGTRFSLTTRPTSSRLAVSEGRVELRQGAGGSAVQVGPGEYAVAARGLDLVARPLPADAGVDPAVPVRIAWFSVYPEDEDWITTPGFVQQRRIYGDAFHPYRAPPLEGSVQLQVLVRVDEQAPGAAWNGEGWAFGIGLQCASDPSALLLRSFQQGPRGSVIEFSDVSGRLLNSSPLDHGPGCYQLKLRLDRLPDGRARFRGKLWRQFEPEPEDWMLVGDSTLTGPLTAIGLSTRNCACTFAQLSLAFLD